MEILHTFYHVQVHFTEMKFFRQGSCVGRTAPSVNLGAPHISETVSAKKLKFYTHLDRAKYSFQYENFSVMGARRVQRPLV